MVWAEEWCRIARELQAKGEDLIDEGWMVGWFANAIETGRSHGTTVCSCSGLGACYNCR